MANDLTQGSLRSTDAHEQRLRQYLERVYNAGDLTAIGELVAPQFTVESPDGMLPITGPAGLTLLHQRLRARFPDLAVQLEELACQPDTVTTRLTITGAWPTAHTGLALFRFCDGKLTEDTAAEALLGLLSETPGNPFIKS